MFIEKKTLYSGHYTLREQFLRRLDKEIKTDSFEKTESALRETLRKKMKKAELF